MNTSFIYAKPDIGVLDDHSTAWMGFIEMYEQIDSLRKIVKEYNLTDFYIFLCKVYCLGVPNPQTLTDVLGENIRTKSGIIEVRPFNQYTRKVHISYIPEKFSSEGMLVELESPVLMDKLLVSTDLIGLNLKRIVIKDERIVIFPKDENCLIERIIFVLAGSHSSSSRFCKAFVISSRKGQY